MDYFQSVSKERKITFKEECQSVCKDDSSSTVTHVCPHHQLQVLLCFVGHLHDNRTSQLVTLKDILHPTGWTSVPCPIEPRAFASLPTARGTAAVPPLNGDPFLSCGKLKDQRKAEACSSLSRLPRMSFKQAQRARHRRRSQAASRICIQTPETPSQGIKYRERDELRPVLLSKINKPEPRSPSTTSVDRDCFLLCPRRPDRSQYVSQNLLPACRGTLRTCSAPLHVSLAEERS